MIEEFTDEEIDYIMKHTGMDIAIEFPLRETPVVYFARNGNVIDFITIFSKELNNL